MRGPPARGPLPLQPGCQQRSSEPQGHPRQQLFSPVWTPPGEICCIGRVVGEGRRNVTSARKAFCFKEDDEGTRERRRKTRTRGTQRQPQSAETTKREDRKREGRRQSDETRRQEAKRQEKSGTGASGAEQRRTPGITSAEEKDNAALCNISSSSSKGPEQPPRESHIRIFVNLPSASAPGFQSGKIPKILSGQDSTPHTTTRASTCKPSRETNSQYKR